MPQVFKGYSCATHKLVLLTLAIRNVELGAKVALQLDCDECIHRGMLRISLIAMLYEALHHINSLQTWSLVIL